jgi:hypothetical protein
MTNVIPFPKLPCSSRALKNYVEGMPFPYDFTADELDQLYRWYSAMKYAFPKTQGIMTVCHARRLSAIGLYGEGGRNPNCLITKHDYGGSIHLLWATEQDPPRRIASVSEITERQIGAIAPPRNESAWLDLIGWTAIFAGRITPDPCHAG